MTIRVLHIVGIMNMGGIENFLMNVYRNIDRDKVQFDFLITREEKGVFDEEIKSLGGRIYNLPAMEKVGYKKYKKNLKKFFEATNYRIVHLHRDMLNGVYLRAANKCGIPVRIAHSHNIKLAEEKNLRGIVKILFKYYSRLFININATDYMACSKEAGKWLFGEKLNNKFRVIKNGIPTSKYIYNEKIRNRIRKQMGIDETTFVLGHVGRFELQKNHSMLISILTEVVKKIPNLKLCLVGDGILKKDIEDRVKKVGLENNVLFLGIRENINEMMMGFDAFIFPSLFEGLGIVLIEAQATGLKCFVSNTIPKEADMQLGLIEYLDIKNVEEWSSKISEFNDKKETLCDQRESEQMILKSKGYDIKNTAEYLQKFYTRKYIKSEVKRI